MFQKGFKKGALPARKVSPLMPIHCLINSKQIVDNSCSILVQSLFNPCSNNQFVFPQKIRVPKNESRFDEPIHEVLGEERGRRAPKKTTILSVFSAIRH